MKPLHLTPLLISAFFPIAGLCDNAQSASAGTPAFQPAYAQFFLGEFRPEDSTPAHKSSAFTLGASIHKPLSYGLSLGVEIDYRYARYNTPPGLGGLFTVVDDTMDLYSMGVGPTLDLAWGNEHLRGHVGGGVGLYFSKMVATGNTLGFEGTHEEKDTAFGHTLRAGLDVRVSPTWHVGVEVRRLWLEASFGPLSYDSPMQIGGTSVMISARVTDLFR